MNRRATFALGSTLLSLAASLLALASTLALLPVLQDRAPVGASPFIVTIAVVASVASAFGVPYLLAAVRSGRAHVIWACAVAPWMAFALAVTIAVVSGCARVGGGCG